MTDKDGVEAADVTARAGGTAAGGVDPRPEDPDTPAAARQRHARDAAEHSRAGFGDDKGGDAG